MAAAPATPIRARQRQQNDIITVLYGWARSPKGKERRLLSTNSYTDHETIMNPDPDPSSDTSSESDSFSDPDTESGIGPDSDSEGEYLRKRLDYHGAEGRAKPRQSDWTKGLVKREFEHWQE